MPDHMIAETPMPQPNSMPRLLVSIRSVAEAREALKGGCDIVDIKEPKRGSLGMSDLATICEVVAALASETTELSAALGEAADWAGATEIPALPAELKYLKVGLAALRGGAWRDCWSELRQRFDSAAGKRFEWVAVAYADWQQALAPEPAEVIAGAAALGVRYVLFDTHMKDGRSLLDWFSPDELRRLEQWIHSLGMQFAVAGALRNAHLREMAALSPYAVAIRSAGCRNGDRNGAICEDGVAAFKAEMHTHFAGAG